MVKFTDTRKFKAAGRLVKKRVLGLSYGESLCNNQLRRMRPLHVRILK